MGRPHFFSPLGLFLTLRFILWREHRQLGDRALGLTSDAALLVLAVHVFGFVLLVSLTGIFNPRT